MPSWNRITQPDKELFEVIDVQVALRIPSPPETEQELLKGYIIAARQYVENVCGISIMKQGWRYSLDQFPWRGYLHEFQSDHSLYGSMRNAIELPRCAPKDCGFDAVTSIDKFSYVGIDGARVDFDKAKWQLDAESRPARIIPAYSSYFPGTLAVPNAVQIEFTAGCDDPAKVPALIKQANLFLISHWYDSREPVIYDATPEKIPYGLEVLIYNERVPFHVPENSRRL